MRATVCPKCIIIIGLNSSYILLVRVIILHREWHAYPPHNRYQSHISQFVKEKNARSCIVRMNMVSMVPGVVFPKYCIVRSSLFLMERTFATTCRSFNLTENLKLRYLDGQESPVQFLITRMLVRTNARTFVSKI